MSYSGVDARRRVGEAQKESPRFRIAIHGGCDDTRAVVVWPRKKWLPGTVAHSVIVDRFRCGGVLSRTSRRRVARVTTADQAVAWAGMLARGDVASRADLAGRVGVSRARVTQVLGPSGG